MYHLIDLNTPRPVWLNEWTQLCEWIAQLHLSFYSWITTMRWQFYSIFSVQNSLTIQFIALRAFLYAKDDQRCQVELSTPLNERFVSKMMKWLHLNISSWWCVLCVLLSRDWIDHSGFLFHHIYWLLSTNHTGMHIKII